METPSSHPSLLDSRLRLLRQTPGPNHAQESNDIDFTAVTGPSSAFLNQKKTLALLAHPSSSPSRRYPLTRPGRNNSDTSEMDEVTPVVDRARELHKGKRKSLGDNEDDKNISQPSSLLQQSGSPIQIRALVSFSATSFHSVPGSPLKSSGSEGEEQTMPPFTPHGTPPLTSSTPQGGPEVETYEADVTTVRVDEDSLAHPNYTAMETPRPPGAWTVTPVPLKHASRVTSTASSSWTPLSRANSEPERRSKPETPAGNGLFTPIHSLSHAKPLHVRTLAPPGAWTSTTTQNWSNKQSKIGSIRTKKNTLKVRFDVTESEASTAEVEHQVPPVTDMRMPTPNSLPNCHASWSGNVSKTRINDLSQGDALDDPVLTSRPVIPGHYMTPASRANVPPSRPLRKAFSVKVVDAFGRERIDELPIPIANGRADAGDAIRAPPSAKTRTRVSSKNKIRITKATGREVQEDAPEPSSTPRDDPPIGRTTALAQIRQTLREWADSGLSDEDRPPDNLALSPSHHKELEECSRAARRSRNQLTLRMESVKECERNLMHKYTKGAEGRSELLPTITSTGEIGSFHRDLVWVGVLLQIVFVLAVWQFAHVQARHLFCAVYYDPLYPGLNPRIGGRAWERWAERPNAETWPPT
ncbi:hypothetical protein BDR05DRAFT_240176 [Suillus weaverae]|nr:hypothetical protein BDR05DRAFT_240176 [Suillus weaverae]